MRDRVVLGSEGDVDGEAVFDLFRRLEYAEVATGGVGVMNGEQGLQIRFSILHKLRARQVSAPDASLQPRVSLIHYFAPVPVLNALLCKIGRMPDTI